jgi:AraC-like DNA-binding protein
MDLNNYDFAEVGSRVLAPAATGVAEHIARNGGDPDRVFGDVGIDPDRIDDPTRELSLRSYCSLFDVAARHTQNDNIGLWFGQQFPPANLGMLGYVAIYSDTLRTALANFVELFPYHQQGTLMRLGEADGLLKLEYSIRDARIIDRRQDAELSMGMFVNIFRHCNGSSWSPEEVHFEHPAPEAWKEHERAFNSPVYFNQPTNAILFRRETLDLPMPNGDSRLLMILRTSLEQLGAKMRGTVTVADQVRSVVRAKLAFGYPALETVADALRLPAWTIQRRLADSNMTYKDLVEETRRELALHYLRQPHLPLSELAFLLGYSELSAFSRAFRRWTGVSPKAYRNAGGNAAPAKAP